MKQKNIFVGILALVFGLLTGCGVELRDRNQEPVITVRELIVDGEYAVPIPEDSKRQMVLHYDRLVLRPGAVFITSGLNLKITVTELLSDDGTIATFPERSFAADLTQGRHGGHLEIQIAKATGKLALRMQGENGGKGYPGKSGDFLHPQLIAAKGASGQDCVLMPLQYAGFCFPGTPASGAPGATGFQGETGLPGLPGGNSGFAYVSIADSESFELTVLKVAGEGGAGGEGGVGGMGGLGGDPGKFGPLGNTHSVPEPQRGPQGPQGPPGNRGPQGESGQLQQVCIKDGSKPANCNVIGQALSN